MQIPSRVFVQIALAALAVQVLCIGPALATRLIPFQGRVTDGAGEPLQGVYRITFAIYDEATGGTALYTESHGDVSVIGGQVNVLLGSLVSLDDQNGDGNPDDAVHFDDALRPRYLGIKVGDETNQEMVPRHQLVPSFHARIADTTVDKGVGTEQLADGAVTVAKIAPEAVLPAGAIMPYGGRTAPPGWVLCDGSTYDGSLPQYAGIFNAIGTAFGGSGNMFRVPDLRGRFLRGLDAGAGVDPDFASRTGGEGASKIGSTQASAVFPLTGSGTTSAEGNHSHSYGVAALDVQAGGNYRFIAPDPAGPLSFPTTGVGNHNHVVTVSVIPVSGQQSTEVRPANIAVNYICKL
jgi:microcystin-dependent protein